MRERCIILEEIRKMGDIPLEAALDLIDQLRAGALSSPGSEGEGDPPPWEPPDPEYLGRLISQVAARKDLPEEERRLLMYRVACAGSETDRAREAERPEQGVPASLRAPARGRNTVTGEEVELPLSCEELLLTFPTGGPGLFRALLGDTMYRNLADDGPGDRTADPPGEGMKSDIAGGDEHDAGKQMHGELTIGEWDGTRGKGTPLDHKREKEQ